MDFKIVPTADGSPTIFLPWLNEHYHSVNGAITESNHVFIERGYLHHLGNSVTVFEIGFGTGLNISIGQRNYSPVALWTSDFGESRIAFSQNP